MSTHLSIFHILQTIDFYRLEGMHQCSPARRPCGRGQARANTMQKLSIAMRPYLILRYVLLVNPKNHVINCRSHTYLIFVHHSIFIYNAEHLKVFQLSLVLLHAHPRCSKGEQRADAIVLAVVFVVAVARGPY